MALFPRLPISNPHHPQQASVHKSRDHSAPQPSPSVDHHSHIPEPPIRVIQQHNPHSEMAPSIQAALADTSLPLETMQQTYAPFLSLTDRILGAPPHFLALAHPSPLTHIFYLAGLRTTFHIPECDLHLLKISPSLRREALFHSSTTHRCPYCTAHVAAMGDVINGPLVAQCARRGELILDEAPGAELVRKFVGEVCGFPGVLTEETRAEFLERFGEKGFTEISSMICFMGWLNFTMGAAGMKLESRMLPFAEVITRHRRLPFNLRAATKNDNEEHLGEAEVANVRRRGVIGKFMENMKNAWGLIALIGPVASAGWAEKNWFAGLPTDVTELDDWCAREVGVKLDVFTSIPDPILKRAFALGLRLVYVDEDPMWSREQKAWFLYVIASGMMDNRLRDDALKLLGEEGREEEAQRVLGIARLPNDPANNFEAALKFMHVNAGFADNVTEKIVDGLVEHVQEHRSIVDLAGMVGHFGFWHRAGVLYPSK